MLVPLLLVQWFSFLFQNAFQIGSCDKTHEIQQEVIISLDTKEMILKSNCRLFRHMLVFWQCIILQSESKCMVSAKWQQLCIFRLSYGLVWTVRRGIWSQFQGSRPWWEWCSGLLVTRVSKIPRNSASHSTGSPRLWQKINHKVHVVVKARYSLGLVCYLTKHPKIDYYCILRIISWI